MTRTPAYLKLKKSLKGIGHKFRDKRNQDTEDFYEVRVGCVGWPRHGGPTCDNSDPLHRHSIARSEQLVDSIGSHPVVFLEVLKTNGVPTRVKCAKLLSFSNNQDCQYTIFQKSQNAWNNRNAQFDALALLHFVPDADHENSEIWGTAYERQVKINEMKRFASFRFTVENPFKKTRWCAVDNWFEANIADFEPLESQGPMSRCRLDQRSYVKLMRAMERRGYRGDNSKSWAEKYREIFENGLA